MKSIQIKWLLIAIIGLLAIILAIVCFKIANLNNTISELHLANSSNDIKELNKLIFESHFKDDLVLNSFNITTTIIITFFTVIIALGGYLSFSKINEEINDLKKIQEENNKTATKVSLFKEEFIKYSTLINSVEIVKNGNGLKIYLQENKNLEINRSILYNHISSMLFSLTYLYDLSNTFSFDHTIVKKSITTNNKKIIYYLQYFTEYIKDDSTSLKINNTGVELYKLLNSLYTEKLINHTKLFQTELNSTLIELVVILKEFKDNNYNTNIK